MAVSRCSMDHPLVIKTFQVLHHASAVPGRFEAVTTGQPFTVIVDYAHTPDGLAKALAAARQTTGDAAVHVVFGCGGDRDREKRPLMGEVASRLADPPI